MKIVCISGPTATGKTKLAIELAERFDGEIVSADSMQIYRGMDIGTAKVTSEEMQGIAHHMIDIAEPTEAYSVAMFVEKASSCIEDIVARGKLPIVAGGTGLYTDALVKGRQFAEFDGGAVREKYRKLLEEQGEFELYKMLLKIDAESAKAIHPNNTKRVIRALEVFELTGMTISEYNAKEAQIPPKYDACRIVLNYADRQLLYERINQRVDEMIDRGLINEVEILLKKGVPENSTAMQAIGYKELVEAFRGRCSFETAVENIKQNSRRYAKRQLTWFKRTPNALWLNVDEIEFEDIIRISTKHLEECGVI